MHLFWSYANVKRTSRSSRTTKKGEGGFFDSPVHVSLINILVAVWQRGKWLLSIRRSNILIFPHARQYQLGRCVSYITDIQLFSFSFVSLFRLFELPDDVVFDFHEVCIHVLLWFRTIYDDIKFSSWKHETSDMHVD